MTLQHSIFIMLALGVGWLFWYQLAVREVALAHARRLCESQGLQLLDQSIGFTGFKRKAMRTGPKRLIREYQFEFTSTGEQRYSGKVFLVGKHFVGSELSPFREG